jgi:formylglycine-generating enzyme required for sulfatase activity
VWARRRSGFDRNVGESLGLLALIAALLVLAACSAAPPRPGTEFRDCAQCPAMIVVPPGEFRMGFNGGEPGRPEGPVRQVRIDYPFALGRYEVTQREFAAFVADTKREMSGGCQVWQGGEWELPDDADWTNPGYGRVPFEDEPVACVSWYDARDYAEWLARRTGEPYRLPSEAEWEYAARAGSTTGYFWGSDLDTGPPACDYANIYDQTGHEVNRFNWAPFGCDDGFAQAAPVGSFLPNAFGLHDMIGNVWEWLADCYKAPYPRQPVDGSAVESPKDVECERRVARGGSWITRPSRSRITFRGRDPPETLFSFFGFRVARDVCKIKRAPAERACR